MTLRLLFLEPEVSLRTLGQQVLEGLGFHVWNVPPEASLQCLMQAPDFDLALIDLDGSREHGLTVFTTWRRERPATILIGTSLQRETSLRLATLRAGAHDFLCKPYCRATLATLVEKWSPVLRVPGAALTTPAPPLPFESIDGRRLALAELTLYREEGRICRRGHSHFLSNQEQCLLEYLMRHPNTLLSQEELLCALRISAQSKNNRVVSNYICRLREKMDRGFQPRYIRTVHGRGYRFLVPDEQLYLISASGVLCRSSPLS